YFDINFARTNVLEIERNVKDEDDRFIYYRYIRSFNRDLRFFIELKMKLQWQARRFK
ncbi:hypothetical protein U1Q18_051940, partial [Sarracenia purpurea var. burkii]